jgi:hypothetical protein
VHVKIVYYGAGLSGKTENLAALRRALPAGAATLHSFATEVDRLLILEIRVGQLHAEVQTEPG